MSKSKKDHPSTKLDDLIRLDKLTDDVIVDALRVRHGYNIIYTYIGGILIAVNPYQYFPELYSKAMSDKVVAAGVAGPPHVFSVADAAYVNMITDSRSQSIVVSGDSGSGKTETNRHLLKHLLYRSGGSSKVEKLVLASNQLLESFGNAKTLRNDNSSRFARYNELLFNFQGRVMGSRTVVYLLEKSRVAHVNAQQRNFHIFYQVLVGAPGMVKQSLGLAGHSPSNFAYTQMSQCFTADTVEDAEWFTETSQALKSFDMPEEDILRLIAVILHLGSIEVAADGKDTDKVRLVGGRGGNALEHFCRLMGVSESLVSDCLTMKMTVVAREHFLSPLTRAKALARRDSLATTLYGRLFRYLVDTINARVASGRGGDSTCHFIGLLDIFGFEDFGATGNSFEQLCINVANESLHQFFIDVVMRAEQEELEREQVLIQRVAFGDNTECIELVSGPLGVFSLLDDETRFPQATDESFTEKLNARLKKHKHYSVVKKHAQSAFAIAHYAGQVTYQTQDFLEKNRDALCDDLLVMMGRDACRFSFATNLFQGDFVATARRNGFERRQTTVSLGEPPTTLKGRTQRRQRQEQQQQLQSRQAMTPQNKHPTVSAQFGQSLTLLVTALGETRARFVRCLKPTQTGKPKVFEGNFVRQQCLNTGILETVRIRRAGFGERLDFTTFLHRHDIVEAPGKATVTTESPKEAKKKKDKGKKSVPKIEARSAALKVNDAGDEATRCRRLLEEVVPVTKGSVASVVRPWAVGLTKVFLGSEATRILEERREKYLAVKIAPVLQRGARNWLNSAEKRRGAIRRKSTAVPQNLTGDKPPTTTTITPSSPPATAAPTKAPSKNPPSAFSTPTSAVAAAPVRPGPPPTIELPSDTAAVPVSNCQEFQQHFLKPKGFCCNCFQVHDSEASAPEADSGASSNGAKKPGKLKANIISGDVVMAAMRDFQLQEAETDEYVPAPTIRGTGNEWCAPFMQRFQAKFDDVIFFEQPSMNIISKVVRSGRELEPVDFNVIFNATCSTDFPLPPRAIMICGKMYEVQADTRRKMPGLILRGKAWQKNEYVFVCVTHQSVVFLFKQSRLPIHAESFYETARITIDEMMEMFL